MATIGCLFYLEMVQIEISRINVRWSSISWAYNFWGCIKQTKTGRAAKLTATPATGSQQPILIKDFMCIIDQAWGQDCQILTKFFLRFFGPRQSQVPSNFTKQAWSIIIKNKELLFYFTRWEGKPTIFVAQQNNESLAFSLLWLSSTTFSDSMANTLQPKQVT